MLDEELLKTRKRCEEMCERVARTSELADGYLEQFNAALKTDDDESTFDFRAMDLIPQDDTSEQPTLQDMHSDLEKSPMDWSTESIDHVYQMWKVWTLLGRSMYRFECIGRLESRGDVFRSSINRTQSLA